MSSEEFRGCAAGAVRAAGRPNRADRGRARLRALPGQKRISRDPGEGVDQVPELRGARGRRSTRLDSESGRSDMEGRRTWVWSSAVTRRDEMMNRNLRERTNRDSNSK